MAGAGLSRRRAVTSCRPPDTWWRIVGRRIVGRVDGPRFTMTMFGGPDDGQVLVVCGLAVVIEAECVDQGGLHYRISIPVHRIEDELIAVWPANAGWYQEP